MLTNFLKKVIESLRGFVLLLEKNEAEMSFGAMRSPEWPEARAKFIKEHPCCEVCESRKGCEVHHRQPFHINPALELDPANLITLCRDHHFLFGHLMDWRSFNKDVAEDAKTFNNKILKRP